MHGKLPACRIEGRIWRHGIQTIATAHLAVAMVGVCPETENENESRFP